MLDWLVDNAKTLCVVLGIVALCLAALWWMNRKRYYLIALGVVAGLIVLVVVLSFLVVTDRQQIRSNILAMRDGVVEGKPDAVFKHFARDFRVDFMDRQTFVDRATQAIRLRRVGDIVLWDFDFETPPDRTKNALVAFRARAEGQGGDGLFLVRAEFVFEEGQWRMRTLRLFNGIVNTDQPIPIPIP
jgi:4-amino-4-deoxy-L-arabinose transferase-like glycosyltransferase